MRPERPPAPAHTLPTVEGPKVGRAAVDPVVDPAGVTQSWSGEEQGGPGVVGGSADPLRRVAQFVLLERLGAGGMGVVFAAFDEKLERKVAIKLVTTQPGDAPAQGRLLREAQAQAKLSHPNVVTVYEVGALPDGHLFIAMELVKGQTLRAWQRDAPRTWREILAMYSQAGRGLAAAHDSGIIHRDFKPDNILLGQDGRVRVADFGLAFAAEPPEAEGPRRGAAPEAGPASPALTAVGVVAGTPGYMAPEQLLGGQVDARTDQFAFCVSLYEALYDERPFADLAFLQDEPPAPRRTEPHAEHPRWLWSALQRGLAIEPERRFASMQELLDELTRSRGHTTRRALKIAAVLGMVATTGVTVAALSAEHPPPPCPLATEELRGVWDPESQDAVRAALLSTAAPFASSIWASTQASLDRYATRWLGAQQAACQATNVRHVQSAELLDLRMECLAARRRSLAAAVDVLRERPDTAVARTDEILASLGEIQLCADTGVLLQLGRDGAQPGGSAADRAADRVAGASARDALALARALVAGDDVNAAGAALLEARRHALHVKSEPLRAEISVVAALIMLRRGEVAEGVAELDRAIELAIANRHDELPADVWILLAREAGTREMLPAQIATWIGHGEAWLRRLNHPDDPRRIQLEVARGNLELTQGKAQDALVTLTRALEAAEAHWGASDSRLIPVLRDRALAQARLRQAAGAVADAERALALGAAVWGPRHPDLARTQRTLGLLYIEQLGQVERGEREVQQALESFRQNLGEDSIEVANCEQVLSVAGQYKGDYAAALEHAERAERVFRVQLGPTNPRRGEALVGVGVLRFFRGDFVGSLQAYQDAAPILRAALGDAHTTVAVLHSNTGETLLALGRPEAARQAFVQALKIFEPALGSSHADLALPLKGLGLAHLALGQPSEAVTFLQRALALRTGSAAASNPQEVAEIQWALARALRGLRRDPGQARQLAQAALATYRTLGPESDAQARAIARWLGVPLGAPPAPPGGARP
ncbi:MAG: serine/threonine-protein kinase [Kofleriaceae bacterium]